MIGLIKSWFKKPLPRGKIYHMQDHQGWGNAIYWSKWPNLKVYGHLFKRPKLGDILTCDFESGERLEFQFIDVEYCRDPADMFFADVEYLGIIDK